MFLWLMCCLFIFMGFFHEFLMNVLLCCCWSKIRRQLYGTKQFLEHVSFYYFFERVAWFDSIASFTLVVSFTVCFPSAFWE